MYHVLHLLSYPGGRGIPHPWLGVPQSWGIPIVTWPGGGVTPSLAEGYSIMGTLCPDLGPVTEVLPRKDMGQVEVLWDGDGVPPWM